MKKGDMAMRLFPLSTGMSIREFDKRELYTIVSIFYDASGEHIFVIKKEDEENPMAKPFEFHKNFMVVGTPVNCLSH